MRTLRIATQLIDLPKPYHTSVMAEIGQQTDRGAAIIGGAYLDLVLRAAITPHLTGTLDQINRLFEERGRLHPLGQRITSAFDLGIIGQRARDDLRILKSIRNAFAHSAESMDFGHTDIVALCSDLWFAQTIKYGRRPAPSPGKELFIRSIEILTDGLYENLSRRRTKIEASKFLMMGPTPASAS